MKANRKLADFGELWPAEAKIRDEIDSGNFVVIGENLPDADVGQERQVRASFIRYLALGGCKKCKTHEKGLRVRGADIFGDGEGDDTKGIDLEGCVLTLDLVLYNCRIEDMVLLRSCSGKTFNFIGSELLAGITADRLVASGSLNLRDVKVEGKILVIAAKIGNNLDFGGAQLFNGSGAAVLADGSEIQGSVFLNGAKSNGIISLIGIKLGGDLICSEARFSNPFGVAISLDRLEAKRTFFLHKSTKIEGRISLSGAKAGALSDDLECWPSGEDSIGIDGFCYEAIIGENAPTDAASRLKWLAKVDHMNDFSPQPYEQLAQVLRGMGHRNDARDVLIEKERLQRRARRMRLRAELLFEDAYWFSIWDRFLSATVRYGYQPFIAVVWLGAFLITGAFVFGNAEAKGAFKPNSSRVWQDDAWTDCAGPDQMDCYLASDEGKSYPKFSALIYSADTLLPIVDLELQNVWIPDEAKAPWVRRYLWVQILAGWALSLLAVAGFSGLIKKSD